MKMVIDRGFLVTTCVLTALCALGTCQPGLEIDNDSFPGSVHENDFPSLEPPPEEWSPIPDQKSPNIEAISSYAPREETSESIVVTTIQSTTTEPPLPEADYKYSILIDGKDNVCLRLCLKAKFVIPYTVEGEEGTQYHAEIPLTNKAVIGGDCGTGKNKNERQILKLQWGGDKYTFKMEFSKTRSGDTDNWLAQNLELTYDTGDTTYFPGGKNVGTVKIFSNPKSEYFETPWKNSYTCKTDDSIEMNSEDQMDRSFLQIDEIQVQAFMHPSANGTFSEGEPCESDKEKKPTSNVASVAVGATLGCLILIVIIIYAVGRRMGSITDRTGYKAVE